MDVEQRAGARVPARGPRGRGAFRGPLVVLLLVLGAVVARQLGVLQVPRMLGPVLLTAVVVLVVLEGGRVRSAD